MTRGNAGFSKPEKATGKTESRTGQGGNFNRFRTCLIVSCTTVLLLGCIELCGQALFFAKHDFPLIFRQNPIALSRSTFEVHPFLVGRLRESVTVSNREKTITTTRNHSRWTHNPGIKAATTKVIAIGGSTTFCTGVTDQDTWPTYLQKKLGAEYEVVNFGVPGYSTAEHIIQMALLVPEESPDWVIFYIGWNDLKNYHDPSFSADYYHHGLKQVHNLAVSPPSAMARALEEIQARSSIFLLAKKFRRELPASRKPEMSSLPDPGVDRVFLRNVGTLLLLSEAIGAKVMIVPQVLNLELLESGSDDSSSGWTSRIPDTSVPILMNRLNSLLRMTALENSPAPLIIDEIESVQWSEEDFVDQGHFNPRGNEKFADVLFQRFMALSRLNQSGILNPTKK